MNAEQMVAKAHQPAATDYDIDPVLANMLYGVATMPANDRFVALMAMGREHGWVQLIGMMAEFIGLANSVAENAGLHAASLLVEFGLAHPYTAERINMPSILGALNGLQLVKGIDTSTVCHGCAFRRGSIANQSLCTTMDAEHCTSPGEEAFMCHENMDTNGNPTTGCRGFAQRRAANNAALRAEEARNA